MGTSLAPIEPLDWRFDHGKVAGSSPAHAYSVVHFLAVHII